MHQELRAACLLDGIELGNPIGQGGCATVFDGRWRDREVAVKVLGEGTRLPATPPRHPAILGVLTSGRALGRPYLVLERFPGDLAALLEAGPLRPGLLRALLLPILDALEFAHRQGIVHGDVKPANVLVDLGARPPRATLADFGMGRLDPRTLEVSLLSRERPPGGGVATAAYMAPEQRAGSAPSPPSDVYALGVLLFETLTGRRPAGLELPSELAPHLGRAFDAPLKAALALEPRRRPSVSALRRELLRALPPPAPSHPEADMVFVPGGFLVVGDRDDPDARPMHERRLRPFWIDLTPVTNEDYARFVQSTGARRPASWPERGGLPRRLARLPVTGITWHEARAYAAWTGRRLPTEFEWERAAQGPEQRAYPYGETFDPERIHCDPRQLAPVGSYPQGASSEGILDLTGNGWEWTASPFVPYGSDRKAPDSARTVRGGFDPSRPRSASATCRMGLRPDARDPGVTFRCALDAHDLPPARPVR